MCLFAAAFLDVLNSSLGPGVGRIKSGGHFEIGCFELAQHFAGSFENRLGQTGQPGDVNAVTLSALPGTILCKNTTSPLCS